MRILCWALGVLAIVASSIADGATIEYTEPSGSNLTHCLISVVSSNGTVLQGFRLDTLSSSGGAQRSYRFRPSARSKDLGAAINVSCCNRSGICSEVEQEPVDLIDMLPEEMGDLSFDGSTISYLEPSTYLNDGSPIVNLVGCDLAFVTASGDVIQTFRQSASGVSGGGSRTLAVQVSQRVRDTGAFLDGSCLTDLGVRGVIRRLSIQGVFQ